MNTLVYQSKSRAVLRSILEVLEPTPPESSSPTTSQGTTAESDTDGIDSVTLHSFVRDSHGAHLENFPFAFVMFGILLTGATATLWGILLTSAWLAAIGFSITLAGCALYGWSLYDE
jgi:hypothetical protein